MRRSARWARFCSATLDVTIQDQILRLLAQLCRESGVSLVFVTHDLPVVARDCR